MTANPIKYYSTNRRAPEVTFREALLKGIAPDGGLYMPSEFPCVTREELSVFSTMEYYEIALAILNNFIGDEISKNELVQICRDSYNFDIPLEKLSGRKYIMRLDRGPTASFKDFAARMMSRLMQHFLLVKNQKLTILTATSGDTGSAVASAFYEQDNIDVIILFPEKEVSEIQRKQMTTFQKNIRVISVKGKFDDCQQMVKMAFNDRSLSHIPLSSANSINIGRLLPQSVYYFYAWSRLAANTEENVIFSVPSGNFGNLMGGLIALKMGLPIEKFIVATNANNEVPEYLRMGVYKPVIPSADCISSAMNVGHPSNLARIIALYGGTMDESGKIVKEPDLKSMRSNLFGISVSDEETRKTIADTYRKFKVMLEPHGAIAWHGIGAFSNSGSEKRSRNKLMISLETAHPAKFPDGLKQITGIDPVLPPSLKGLYQKEERLEPVKNNYEELKKLLLKFHKTA